MNNYPAIEKGLRDILPIAEKHNLTDVLGVVAVGECSCRPGNDRIYCDRCDGTGRVLRDWSDLPDGSLAGSWENLFPVVVYVSYTDDLGATKGVLRYLEAQYGR